MDPNSGKIYRNIDDETAKKHGLVPIPPEDEQRVQRMNRHQRRAWASQQRKRAANG
jgi:predicted Zn-dependent protease